MQPALLADIREGPVPVVAVKPRALARVWSAEVVRRNVTHVLDGVSGYKNVRPPVVVVVEEPAWEAPRRLRDACILRNLGEAPAGARRAVDAGGAVIAKKHGRPVEARDEQVRTPVVVEIGTRDALHEPDDVEAVFRGAFRERAVAVVAEELARMRIAVPRLVADEEVQPAVPVVIEPDGRLRCV